MVCAGEIVYLPVNVVPSPELMRPRQPALTFQTCRLPPLAVRTCVLLE